MRRPEEVQIGEYTLKEILERHELYLSTNETKSEFRADLQNIDLSYVDLIGANLQGVIWRNVNLSYSNLSHVNLKFAEISYSNFTYANLPNAQLIYASIHHCNFYGADFMCARLRQTLLYDTILTRANFYAADLSSATLDCTNIDQVDFTSCNLYHAKIFNAIGNLLEYRKGKILTESIIGYKKCRNNVIVTLEIPKDAIVFSINGSKCRTNKAKVIAIDGTDRAFSSFSWMSYHVGDEFNIKNFNCEYNAECANGIHFFMTRKEAENYSLI